MKRSIVFPLNPIQKRANSKIVNLNGRYFLIGNIGGMTTSKSTCDIYQCRLTHPQEQKYQIQWRPLKFENHVFTPRNSFSAVASQSKIYIWGGLQSNQKQMVQKCLSDLIEVDIETGKMCKLSLKQTVAIHSAILFYDKQMNSLIGYGGTNQNSSMEAYLYELKLDLKQGEDKYQWKKRSLKGVAKQGVLWQHSGNIYTGSLFLEKQNQISQNNAIKQQPKLNHSQKYLLVVGGCRYPWSPYKTITQINLLTNQITGTLQLQQALVAHESVYDQYNHCVYLVGGANGGGFNRWIYRIGLVEENSNSNSNSISIEQEKKKQAKIKIQKIQGHNSVGGACLLTKQNWLLVYGGVCGPEMLNDMIMYHK